MVESLLALPFVIFFGLFIVQIAWLWQGHITLRTALNSGSRAGISTQADPAQIESAIVEGLSPLYGGVDSMAGVVGKALVAKVDYAFGQSIGMHQVQQLSPTSESFADWGQPARDVFGKYLKNSQHHRIYEIPAHIIGEGQGAAKGLLQPASGVARKDGTLPVGKLSQQSLADAQVLKLKLSYGVRLNVPFVGPLMASFLRLWYGCASTLVDSSGKMGVVDFSASKWTQAAQVLTTMKQDEDAKMACKGLNASKLASKLSLQQFGERWVMHVTGSMRMLTPARPSSWVKSGGNQPVVVQKASGLKARGQFGSIDTSAPKR